MSKCPGRKMPKKRWMRNLRQWAKQDEAESEREWQAELRWYRAHGVFFDEAFRVAP